MEQVTKLSLGRFSVDVTGMSPHDAKASFRILVLTFLNSQGRELDDATALTIAQADALVDKHGIAAKKTIH
jgi:hypothetical protein